MPTQSHEVFPATHFEAGKNVGAGSKGPTLADLLNVVHQAFYSGLFIVEEKGPRVEFLFKAICPLNGFDLDGHYVLDLNVFEIGDGTHPQSKAITFDNEACLFGTVLAKRGAQITFKTDANGRFNGAFMLKKGKAVEDSLFLAATANTTLDKSFVHRTKHWTVAPILSPPFMLVH